MTELKKGELLSTRHLLTPLDGQTFTYRELQEAVLEHFNKHTGDKPTGYNYQHLIDWGQEHGWIQKPESDQFRVVMPELTTHSVWADERGITHHQRVGSADPVVLRGLAGSFQLREGTVIPSHKFLEEESSTPATMERYEQVIIEGKANHE